MNIPPHIVTGKHPTYAFFSGIHGDERGIILSLKKAIDAYKHVLVPFLYIPICSPSAVLKGTRENADGLDLNRCFLKKPLCAEAEHIISLLQDHSFEVCVDFHEDTELKGVYLYDSKNIEGTTELEAFRKRVISIAPLQSGTDDANDELLGSSIHNGYRASLPPQKDTNGQYIYEGFLDYWALIEEKTKRWMTLEIPSSLSQSQKDAVVEIFFQTFIMKYEGIEALI